MSRSITLDIPDELFVSARAMAAAANLSMEETLLAWLRSAAQSPPVETLTDESLLRTCDMQLEDEQQLSLSALLERQREATLTPAEQDELDLLMNEYRRGLILKARALKEAIDRGLRSPLNANVS